MQIIIKSKYEKDDYIFLQAFSINTYRKEKILEVAATRDNKAFIYRINTFPISDSFNWILEENVCKTLEQLKMKWIKDLENPIEYKGDKNE